MSEAHSSGAAHGGHAEHRRHSGVAITLAAAAVAASALGARAAVLLGSAGDELQSSVRTDVKRSAALVEDVRFLYEAEAPTAYRYAKAHVTAVELKRAAAAQSGSARAETLVEAEAQANAATVFRRASAIAKDSRYERPGGGFDLGRRLADIRGKLPELVRLDPGKSDRRGTRLAWHGNLDAAATLGPALAFFLAALGQAFARRRRPLLVAAWALLAAGLAAGIAWELVLP